MKLKQKRENRKKAAADDSEVAVIHEKSQPQPNKILEDDVQKMLLNLPGEEEDDVCSILLTLPSNSLLRLKTVSDYSSSLISSPSFVKRHFNRTNQSDNYGDWRYITLREGYFHRYCHIATFSCDANRQYVQPTEFEGRNYFDLIGTKDIDIEGYCNGVFLIRASIFGYTNAKDEIKSTKLLLWNPTTGVRKTIYSCDVLWSRGFRIMGLCCDSTCDEFKVIRGFLDETHVYSSETNIWKPILRKRYLHDEKDFILGPTLNGAQHWLLHGRDEQDSVCTLILCFDAVTNEFKEVAPPGWLRSYNISKSTLHIGSLEGCLSITCCVRGQDHGVFEIWTMSEYGIKGSWIKRFVIDSIGKWRNIRSLWPIWFKRSNNDLLVVINGRKLVWYNTRGNSNRLIGRLCHKQSGFAMYSESLFSLGPEIEDAPLATGRERIVFYSK